MMSQQKQKPNTRPRRSTPQYKALESRHLLAAIHFDSSSGQLYIAGDSGDNVASLSMVGTTTYRATVDSLTRDLPISSITGISFLGFAGNDQFTNNTDAALSAFGHLGNDTLVGGSGNENLVGGAGNDTIHGNGGNDRLVGANGNDTIHGGDGNDNIFGSAGTNTLNGNDGDDVIYGSNDGDDTLNGGVGIDWLFGLGGDDELRLGSGGTEANPELAMGHAGNDAFFAGAGFNLMWGGNDNDTMTAGDGTNRMHGQAGNDTLNGGRLADLLRGHAGNDTIRGGGGNDVIEAGTGAGDIVVFGKTYEASTVSVTANGQNATVVADARDTVTGAEWFSFTDRQITTNQANLAAQELSSFNSLNNYRNGNSLSTFSHPSDLTTFAENWSKRMADIGLVHSSDAARRTLLTGSRVTIGENIIQISDIGQTAQQVGLEMHNLWITSTVHRNNMLNGAFNEVGVGIYLSGGFWWGTHVFAG